MVRALSSRRSAKGAPGGDTLQASVGELAPPFGWDAHGADEHLVQFYESDEFLLDTLAGFIAEGLKVGDACIVVARGAHRESLDARLRTRGLDPEAARLRGQLFTLDAAETLSRLMSGGAPEPARFEEVVGGLVARAASGPRRVRIFGEMVALLWAEGNPDAALRLEALWNNLQKRRPFLLFCAYPMSGFGGEAHAGPFSHVCAEHTRVVPAESYTARACADERLLAIVELQRKAASLEAEIAERREAEAALRSLKDDLERESEERRRLLVRESAARAEAEEANRLKDEFLATISHELRTPLTAIIGWSHMLCHAGLDEATTQRGLETIERNAKIQAQLVDDLLDVSHVVTGKLSLSLAPVDLMSVVGAAVDSVRPSAESKGVRLEVALDSSASRVAGDAGRLQQVVWTLLSNAVKFTEPGGRVGVRLRREGLDAELSVCDDGCGISPDFLPYVFDRFRQGDQSTTRVYGGLGLGLSIVRHLVELHGGTVSAESEGEGRGSTFIVRLPLAVRV